MDMPVSRSGMRARATPLIWGYDLFDARAVCLDHCDHPHEAPLRWVHLDLNDNDAHRWIAAEPRLTPAVRDLLTSEQAHQRALVDDGVVAMVIHDIERGTLPAALRGISALRVAMTPALIVTTRTRPMRSAEVIRARIERTGAMIGNRAEALEILVGSIADGVIDAIYGTAEEIHRADQAFLDGTDVPAARDLMVLRRRIAAFHRQIGGMRSVFARLEHDATLPGELLPVVRRVAQRLAATDGDVLSVQGELRLLRDELDIQETQRTNRNLYALSVITALLLPATLVTGIFGMNTQGLPFADGPWGTLHAATIALAGAGLTYLFLRWRGFLRR